MIDSWKKPSPKSVDTTFQGSQQPQVRIWALRKWLLIFGLFGAGWMAFALYLGSWLLVTISNYPGQLLAQWAHDWWAYYRGDAPAGGTRPLETLWINVWLVLTSALEWTLVGLMVCAIAQRISERRRKRG